MESVATDGADLRGRIEVVEIFGADHFRTRFNSVKGVAVAPGERLRLPREAVERCLVPLSGRMWLELGDHVRAVEGRTVVMCPPDTTVAVANRSSSITHVLLAEVRVEGTAWGGAGDPALLELVLERLDRSLLSPFAAHLGRGEIEFRSVFDRIDSSWNSIDHVVLPPGTSVGYHRNHNTEEVFVIIEGEGRMKIEGEVVEVRVGDCISNPLGGLHGIANHRPAPLEFLNFSVSVAGGPAEVADLEDDLGEILGPVGARADGAT